MNVKNIFNKDAWAGGLKATGMKLNDAKPEIMVFTGLISLVIGTIWMCTKTEEGKEEVLKYKEANATIKNSEIPELADNEKALKIEKGKMYVKNTGYFIYRMGKIYGGPILLWVGGALMVTWFMCFVRPQKNCGLSISAHNSYGEGQGAGNL